MQKGCLMHPHVLPELLAVIFFFFNDTATTEIYTLSQHDALPILCPHSPQAHDANGESGPCAGRHAPGPRMGGSGRDRHGARGPALDEPPDLAAGDRAAARGVLRPGDARLELVARSSAGAAVSPCVRPV